MAAGEAFTSASLPAGAAGGVFFAFPPLVVDFLVVDFFVFVFFLPVGIVRLLSTR
jgi:hypothetical protein